MIEYQLGAFAFDLFGFRTSAFFVYRYQAGRSRPFQSVVKAGVQSKCLVVRLHVQVYDAAERIPGKPLRERFRILVLLRFQGFQP